jgi:hypothetical protein
MTKHLCSSVVTNIISSFRISFEASTITSKHLLKELLSAIALRIGKELTRR